MGSKRNGADEDFMFSNLEEFNCDNEGLSEYILFKNSYPLPSSS